jgi:hypothetical protein
MMVAESTGSNSATRRCTGATINSKRRGAKIFCTTESSLIPVTRVRFWDIYFDVTRCGESRLGLICLDPAQISKTRPGSYPF